MSGRYANRQDVMHKPIVSALEDYGVTVYLMPDPGDILCYGWNRATLQYEWHPAEIKSSNTVRKKKADGSDELTPRQKRLRDQNYTAPIPIIRTVAEGLALFGITL